MIRRAWGWIKGLLPTKEIWKPVVGYEGLYDVSNYGRVRSLFTHRKTGRQRAEPLVMVPRISGKGYRTVGLYKSGGKPRRTAIHLLLLEAFRGPRPDGASASFLDGDNGHCKLGNLAWATPAMLHTIRDRNGAVLRGEGHPSAKLTREDVQRIRRMNTGGISMRALAKQFGCSESLIGQIIHRKIWRHID